MVSKTTRELVWQKKLDVARFDRYYDKLADRYQKRNMALRGALLVASVTGGGTLAAVIGQDVPDALEIAAAVGVAILLVVDSQGGYAYKAAVFASVQRECERLDDRFRILWAEMQAGRLSEDVTLDRHTTLVDQLANARERTAGTHVSTDDKLNEQCMAAAQEALSNRHAT